MLPLNESRTRAYFQVRKNDLNADLFPNKAIYLTCATDSADTLHFWSIWFWNSHTMHTLYLLIFRKERGLNAHRIL